MTDLVTLLLTFATDGIFGAVFFGQRAAARLIRRRDAAELAECDWRGLAESEGEERRRLEGLLREVTKERDAIAGELCGGWDAMPMASARRARWKPCEGSN